MFADIAKMAAKAVALVAGVALVIVLFTQVQIPSITGIPALIGSYLGLAYSVGAHYWGSTFITCWTLGLAIIGFDIAVNGIRLALISIKWILKINE